MPPSSSPPPARPGPPCTSTGSGEPWPVSDLALPGCRSGCGRARARAPAPPRGRSLRIVGEDRGDEAALAAPRQRCRLVDRFVGQRWCDRAERLDIVHRCGRARPVAIKQHRVEERAGARHRPRPTAAGRDRRRRSRHRAAARRCARALPRAAPRLASGPIRVASSAGLPTGGLRQALAERLDQRVGMRRAARSTRRIAVHFCPAFAVISRATSLHEQVELRRARRRRRARGSRRSGCRPPW